MAQHQIDVEALEAGLAQFIGTEGYYRLHANLFPKITVTDGAKYLAEQAEAAWLLSVVASHLPGVRPGEWLAMAFLTVREDHSALLEIRADEGGELYARQEIPFTDFPLAKLTLFCARAGGGWVIMLPTEY